VPKKKKGAFQFLTLLRLARRFGPKLFGINPVVTLQRTAPKLKHKDLHFRPIDLTDLVATRTIGNDVAAEFPVRYLVNNAGENASNP
jgi:hypothetical protein